MNSCKIIFCMALLHCAIATAQVPAIKTVPAPAQVPAAKAVPAATQLPSTGIGPAPAASAPAANAPAATPAAANDPVATAIRTGSANLVTAFNAGKVDDVVGMFLPQGELIDEEGTVYQGQAEIKTILTALFTQFPGATLTVKIDAVRVAGPVAFEEGTRTILSKDGTAKTPLRYLAVWAKSDNGWKLASHRDYNNAPTPTPNEQLQQVAWLVGSWINEGTDGKVAISYTWSDDKNFLLGEFQMTSAAGVTRRSSQRIGWDPLAGQIRSWLFDADGGFSEGTWTVLEDQIVIKSNSVNPDATVATATLTLTPKDKNQFAFGGSDRMVNNAEEPEFELSVVRRPPTSER